MILTKTSTPVPNTGRTLSVLWRAGRWQKSLKPASLRGQNLCRCEPVLTVRLSILFGKLKSYAPQMIVSSPSAVYRTGHALALQTAAVQAPGQRSARPTISTMAIDD